jgi:hypothetical protein
MYVYSVDDERWWVVYISSKEGNARERQHKPFSLHYSIPHPPLPHEKKYTFLHGLLVDTVDGAFTHIQIFGHLLGREATIEALPHHSFSQVF